MLFRSVAVQYTLGRVAVHHSRWWGAWLCIIRDGGVRGCASYEMEGCVAVQYSWGWEAEQLPKPALVHSEPS